MLAKDEDNPNIGIARTRSEPLKLFENYLDRL